MHVISMLLTTIGAIVKTVLLLFNRTESFRKVQKATSLPIRILLVVGVAAGIYVVITQFGGIVPPWLIIKIALFIVAGMLIMYAEKKENKLLMLVSVVLFLLIIGEAIVKF